MIIKSKFIRFLVGAKMILIALTLIAVGVYGAYRLTAWDVRGSRATAHHAAKVSMVCDAQNIGRPLPADVRCTMDGVTNGHFVCTSVVNDEVEYTWVCKPFVGAKDAGTGPHGGIDFDHREYDCERATDRMRTQWKMDARCVHKESDRYQQSQPGSVWGNKSHDHIRMCDDWHTEPSTPVHPLQ